MPVSAAIPRSALHTPHHTTTRRLHNTTLTYSSVTSTTGVHCELEESLDPQCAAQPCRNNGSCSVPPGSDEYVCECAPGTISMNSIE